MTLPDAVCWSQNQVHHALESLLLAANLVQETNSIVDAPSFSSVSEVHAWLVNAARPFGVEGQLVVVHENELAARLARERVLLVAVPSSGGAFQFLALLVEGRRCRALTADGGEVTLRTEHLADSLAALLSSERHRLDALVGDVPGAREAAAKYTRRQAARSKPFYFLRYRHDAASPFWTQFQGNGDAVRLVWLTLLSLARMAMLGVASFTLGRAALDGLVDSGRVVTWGLVMLTEVPLQYAVAVLAGRITIGVVKIIRRRTLEGAFFVPEGILRREGYGATLARLNESSVTERLSALDLFGVVAPLSLLGAAFGAFAASSFGAWFSVVAIVLLVWMALVFVSYVRLHRRMIRERIALTEDVVDKVVGHRTRTVQERPEGRHDGEDQALVLYERTSAQVDARAVWLGFSGRLSLLLAGGLLLGSFVSGQPLATLLPVALGIYLLQSALTTFGTTLVSAASWVAAWDVTASLFARGAQRERRSTLEETAVGADGSLPTALTVSKLSFAYPGKRRAILSDVDLRVPRGARILVEGPSGGGKSTFVKLVAGELKPSGGTLLVSGFDSATAAESQWRSQVASAPQFHENHVFAHTFAFNVDPRRGLEGLTGEAREICEELGLGAVLARMPAGPAQLLGETGWQLSHGERSRVFIARALLQHSPIVVFDESFAALDPETLTRALACVRRRAETLLVIGHT